MARLEKRTEATTHVCVVELRTRAIWERVAKGKAPARGRTRLAGEYPTEQAATEAYRRRLAELQAEGFAIVDEAAGVDDVLRPRSDDATKLTTKLTIDELLRILRLALDALPERPALTLVLDALDQTMRISKRGFRASGYACDLGVRGSAKLVIKVASDEGSWREIGVAAEIAVPDEHETEEECLESETGGWTGFVALVREDAAWQAVAQLPCSSVIVVDDEID